MVEPIGHSSDSSFGKLSTIFAFEQIMRYDAYADIHCVNMDIGEPY